MTTEKTTTKDKQVKYICYSCGVTVKAPEGFHMMCPKCSYELSKTPTTKAEYEAVITKAFEEINSLHSKIEQLENYLNPSDDFVDDDVVDVELLESSDNIPF